MSELFKKFTKEKHGVHWLTLLSVNKEDQDNYRKYQRVEGIKTLPYLICFMILLCFVPLSIWLVHRHLDPKNTTNFYEACKVHGIWGAGQLIFLIFLYIIVRRWLFMIETVQFGCMVGHFISH